MDYLIRINILALYKFMSNRYGLSFDYDNYM